MHKSLLAPLSILALVGLLLVGHGLTGLVTSQSCCFGPTCGQDYLCDEAPSMFPEGSPAASPLFAAQLGGLLLAVLMVVYIAHQVRHHA